MTTINSTAPRTPTSSRALPPAKPSARRSRCDACLPHRCARHRRHDRRFRCGVCSFFAFVDRRLGAASPCFRCGRPTQTDFRCGRPTQRVSRALFLGQCSRAKANDISGFPDCTERVRIGVNLLHLPPSGSEPAASQPWQDDFARNHGRSFAKLNPPLGTPKSAACGCKAGIVLSRTARSFPNSRDLVEAPGIEFRSGATG